MWGKKYYFDKNPTYSPALQIYICSFVSQMPWKDLCCLNFLIVLTVKRCQIEITMQPRKIVCLASSLTQCPRPTATYQANFVTPAHRNKNWSVWIDGISVALEGQNGGTQTNISTYPSIHPSIYLSIHPSSQTSVSLTAMLLTVTGLLTGQREAWDYGTRGQHECLSGWCGEWGLHAVNRLNTPLWHAWNPCGFTSPERKLFDENQLNQ